MDYLILIVEIFYTRNAFSFFQNFSTDNKRNFDIHATNCEAISGTCDVNLCNFGLPSEIRFYSAKC